jgi:restriction system protein
LAKEKKVIMALWLVRAGKYGEHEQKFFSDGRIYLTWDRLENYDLSKATNFDEIKAILRQAYPDFGEGKIANHTGQVWAFVLGMKPADPI